MIERRDLWDPQRLNEFLVRKRDESVRKWARWRRIRGKQVPVFHANAANECSRKACYYLLGEIPTPMDWKGALRVHDGEAHGDSIVFWLEEMGFPVADREKAVRKILKTPAGRIAVSGHIDGTIWIPRAGQPLDGPRDKYVLEMKGLSTHTMRKSGDEIVNKTYRYQAQVYMWMTGLKRALFAVKDKNNSQPRFWELDFNPRVIGMLKSKWLKIVRAVQKKELLPREYVADSLECQWCGFRDRCHGR